MKENAGVAKDMAEHVTGGEVANLSEIAPGSGALIRLDGKKAAAYRDREDEGSVSHGGRGG